MIIISFNKSFNITFLGIALSNIYNIKKSPKYDPQEFMLSKIITFGILISLKSFIYGTFYPISWLVIICDCMDGDKKSNPNLNHFIPFSVY